MSHTRQASVSRRSLIRMAGAAPVVAGGLARPGAALAQSETPVQGGTFTYGSGQPNQNIISPINSLAQIVMTDAIFLRLVYGRQWGDGINPDLTSDIDLAVAETMTEIEKDRVWEFTIRQNVLWHDGTPVTADDVILGIWLSLNRNVKTTTETPIVALKGGERLRAEGAPVGQVEVEGATKLGDRAVRIELERPIPNYWVNWSIGYWPMPTHIFGEMPFEQLFAEPYATMPVGNGPFKVVKYVDGQYVEMAANEDFYLGRPHVDRFIVRFGDADTLTAALEAQEIDGTTVPPGSVYDRLTGLDSLVGNLVPRDYPFGFVVNAERFPEQAAGLNRAIQHAIDVETVSAQLFSGTLRPSNDLFAHVVDYEEAPVGFETRTYDPERATAILQEIGWDSSQEIDWMMWSAPAPTQDALQAMLAAVGINAKYRVIDSAIVIDELYVNGNYDLVFANVSFSQFFEDIWKYIKCGWSYDEGGFNYARYCNEEIDTLWQQGLDEVDAVKRHDLFDQANLLLNAAPPQATLYRNSSVYVWNKRVRGAYPYQDRLPVRPAFEKVWIAED